MNAKEIVIFFTGGTIGMDAKEGRGGAVPGNNQGRIFDALADLQPGLHLKAVAWADLPSPHITPEIMLRLSQDLDAQLGRSEVLGAVVLHGTDLMAETAFLLELTLTSGKPVWLPAPCCTLRKQAMTEYATWKTVWRFAWRRAIAGACWFRWPEKFFRPEML